MSEPEGRPVVLLVDDEPDHLMILEIFLDAAGYAVICAASCAEGRAVLEQRTVDVLVADFFLGDGTAADLIAGLGARRPRLAIVVSGLDRDEDIDRTLQAGFDAHLVKPTPIETLREVIAEGLRRAPAGHRSRAPDTPPPHTKRSAT